MEVKRCSAEIRVGPVSGTVRCQLEDSHACHWHRNDAAGWEWDDGQLWPLLPPRAVPHRAA